MYLMNSAMTEIIWKNPALKFLRQLDKIESKRIVKKVEEEIKLDVKRYLKFLSNLDFLKIRIGNYRLFVDYKGDEDKLYINTIKYRKDAYKNLK